VRRRPRAAALATRAAGTVAALLVLAGCAGAPAPDWAANARGSLERFEAAWLRGDTRQAQSEFERARGELARTGRPDLVAHAELVRCAMQVASLEFDDCPGFAPLAADAGAAAGAYADYLGGRWAAVQPGLLPPQHRDVARAGTAGQAAAALASMEAPVSRLVAAGALLRAGRIDPAGISMAIDTASAQGWRRPLLAWLGVQERRAIASGDAEAAAAIRRRMALVAGPSAR
jgi:hypothetical protein